MPRRIAALLAAVLLAALAAACGAAAEGSPTEALGLIQGCVRTQTYGPLWDTHWCLEGRKRLDRTMRTVLEKNAEYAELATAPSRQLFTELLPMFLEGDDTFAFREVVGERVDGGRAVVTVRHADGGTREITLVAEDGFWKFAHATGTEVFAAPTADAAPIAGYELR